MSNPSESLWDIHIFVCTNEREAGVSRPSCGRQIDAMALIAYGKERIGKMGLQARVRMQKAGCLEYCEVGPATLVYPEGLGFRLQSREDVDQLLQAVAAARANDQRLGDVVDQFALMRADIRQLPVYRAQQVL